jgi:hypothetical protein
VSAALVGCDSGTKQSDEVAVEADDTNVEITVTVPPVRFTPFCEAMIDLSETLLADPPADATPVILETYLALLGEVPTEIEADFVAVIASLQELERTGGGSPPTTDTLTTQPAESGTSSTTSSPTSTSAPITSTTSTIPPAVGPDATAVASTVTITADDLIPDAEGYLPSDVPADAVNSYVDFQCRSSTNNPGPPETVPVDDLSFDDESDADG